MSKRGHLFSLFNSLEIEHETVEHPPLFTVADTHLLTDEIPGAHTKNLFLKDDNKQFWLVSALQETQINLRSLSKFLSAKNLRFSQPELLRQYLNVEPGSVTWFALINDEANQINALLDKAIFDCDLVGFHPLENTATTIVKPASLVKFAEAICHRYEILDFTIT